ncbi:MAG TPA: hypothetical protein VHU77_06835 [Candidatus Limnocylindria bacterium]|jgi:hypothetical protein|nr:hypothetical protein [Candidatus Limnocylindria bacterium]
MSRNLLLAPCVLVMLAACSAPPSPRTANVCIDTRNRSNQDFGIAMSMDNRPRAWGHLDNSSGCYALILPWSVTVGRAVPGGPVGTYEAVASSVQNANAAADVWVLVTQSGEVRSGLGQAPWETKSIRGQ